MSTELVSSYFKPAAGLFSSKEVVRTEECIVKSWFTEITLKGLEWFNFQSKTGHVSFFFLDFFV